MRKLFLLLTVVVLLPLSSVFSQTLEDVVSETRGDTLVIKTDFDYSDEGGVNTLYIAINADTLDVPDGRVYMLKTNGSYSLANNPTTSSTKKIVIMGENNQSVKTIDDVNTAPPVISGAYNDDVNTTGGIVSGYDLLVKNCNIAIGNSAGSIGWSFFSFSGPGLRYQVDNCIVEHTLWVVFGSVEADSRIFLTNNYFVNLDGHTCRRNGGVVDFNSGITQDTLLVENCTHVNTQGSIYKSRQNYKINRQIFNHNNFINCSGYVFMNVGDHTDYSVTNNIFVNCNVQCYSTSLIGKDAGELDLGDLPMGLVNVYNDSAFAANGATFYVDKNLAYWDASFDDCATTLNNNAVNGQTDWVSQMITMNTRSQAMFDDDATYPYLTEGTWITDQLPNFAGTDVLFTDQLAILKAFSISTVDTTYDTPLPSWRQDTNPELEYFTFADWPIPIDLSYDDSDLLTAGMGGFPLGDLAWFPDQYTAWMAQRDDEYAAIHTALYTGVVDGVEKVPGLPVDYTLSQNYPNPFNPTTVIDFTIPKAGNVTLKVYNAVGEEVAILVNGFKDASNYKVDFNASNLASGVYFYTLKVDNNFTQSKKMLLLK
ncbi:MAG: T9SS type A sorting domain-containing protein [Ignavibacteria bacterium]|jgi:hypothetical protein